MRLTRLDWCQNWSDAREFRIKVARVRRRLDLGQEGWRDALVINVVPHNVSEERLAHDLLSIGGAAPKALVRISGEELLKDGDAVSRHVDGVQRLIRENGVVDLILVFTAEWRLLQKHLVNQDAKGPPVNRPAVLLV